MNLILRFWQQLLRFTRQYSEKDAEAYRISQYYSYFLHTFIVILFCVDYLLWRYSTAHALNFKSWGLEDNSEKGVEVSFFLSFLDIELFFALWVLYVYSTIVLFYSIWILWKYVLILWV